MCACGSCAVCIVIAEYTFREYVFIFSVQTQQQEHLKGSVKEPNISIYFFFSAHHSMVFCFGRFVYWWKGSVIFSVLKYYYLNINYSVNILSECLHILMDSPKPIITCSALPPEIVLHDASIGGRSENNIKCFVRDDFLSFIVVEHIRFFHWALHL